MRAPIWVVLVSFGEHVGVKLGVSGKHDSPNFNNVPTPRLVMMNSTRACI